MGKNILVVDDDEVILDSVKLLLEEEGYNVKTLPNGLHIEDTLEKFPPDLILLDYLMPGQNGGQIAYYIRSQKKTHDIPIIMLLASKQYEEVARKMGVDTFIAKPFDIDFLLQQISLHINTYKPS